MAMVINSNIQSLNAQRHLNNSLDAQNTATERLSSGLRINSAKDDAAGLAIANRMTSQIQGLNQAVRNANDGAAMIQTAEGGMEETTNILQRMRELSIQSANGTYDTGNRDTLNAEVKQLKLEIDRISETTSFNGLNVLDGSMGEVGLQVGENANQTIAVNIGKMDTTTLGSDTADVDVVGSQTNLHAFASFGAGATDTDALRTLGVDDVMINGQSIVKTDLNLNDATSTTQTLIDAINTNVKGVTAGTIVENVAANVGDGFLSGTDKVTVVVAGLDESITSIEIKDTINLQEMVDQINDKAGGLVTASINDDGKLAISGENLGSIGVIDGTTLKEATGTVSTTKFAAATVATAIGTLPTPTEADAALISASIAAGIPVGNDDIAISTATITLTSDDPITIERGANGSLEDLSNLGFRESTSAGAIEGVETLGAAFDQGDLTINDVAIAKSDSASLADKISAINAKNSETGVTAQSYTSVSIDTRVQTGTAGAAVSFSLNGVDVLSGATGAAGDATTIANINALTDEHGITARATKHGMLLEGNVDSINIGAQVAGAGNALLAFGTAAVYSTASEEVTGATSTTNFLATTNQLLGGIQLTSDEGEPISVVNKDAAAATKSGLLDSNAASGALSSTVDKIDISTVEGANKAIGVLTTAIETVSETRGELGAISNRLDYTTRNLSNISENASSSRSAIMDADFAAESANLSRAQVLQQAGNAMLAQANSRPQQVLSLLQ